MGRKHRDTDEALTASPKAAKPRSKKSRGKKGRTKRRSTSRFTIGEVAPRALLVGSGALLGAAVSWVLRGRSR